MGLTPIEEADRLIAEGHPIEDRGDFEGALALYRQAAAASPGYPRAHLNLGNALRALRRRDEAATAFRTAILHVPAYAQAHFNLATLLAEDGDREGAKAALAEALRLQPAIVEKVLDAESYLLFSTSFREILDPSIVASEHMRVGAAIARAAGAPFATWSNQPDPYRKLRIGYVSADYGPHPVSLFVRPVLEGHDCSRFEAYCYSNTGKENATTVAFRSRVAQWRDIAGMDDALVADMVRSDGIDILVDLSGHTQGNRLGVFAKHPAPIQVTWLGYLNTTGLAAMDYRICDRHTEPEGESDGLHSEQLCRMPHSQWCYVAWMDTPLALRPHVESPEAIVFGSFNQHLKISDRCLDLWCRILVRLPEAKLVMLDMRDLHLRDAMASRLQRRGIDRSRVDLRDRMAVSQYYTALGNVDVALDTFPHNGGTTTFDALWMGTPIVALRGDRGLSRSCYSILKTLGADELIAHDVDEYVEINVRLAKDPVWRARLRQTLRPRLRASPLMDAKQFVTALEARFREMWHAWCARAPERSSTPSSTRT